MKGLDFGEERNRFLGICDHCGEFYEAESATEDLEGITFRCRKALCEGQVSLTVTDSSGLGLDGFQTSFSVADFHPKKFC